MSIVPVFIQIPDAFIGKWCVATVNSGPSTFDKLAQEMFFETKEDVVKYIKKTKLNPKNISPEYYYPMQVSKTDDGGKTYPYWVRNLYIYTKGVVAPNIH